MAPRQPSSVVFASSVLHCLQGWCQFGVLAAQLPCADLTSLLRCLALQFWLAQGPCVSVAFVLCCAVLPSSPLVYSGVFRQCFTVALSLVLGWTTGPISTSALSTLAQLFLCPLASLFTLPPPATNLRTNTQENQERARVPILLFPSPLLFSFPFFSSLYAFSRPLLSPQFVCSSLRVTDFSFARYPNFGPLRFLFGRSASLVLRFPRSRSSAGCLRHSIF